MRRPHREERIARHARHLHTLAKRPHCFQRAASPGTGSYTWLDRVWEFLNHKGFNNP